MTTTAALTSVSFAIAGAVFLIVWRTGTKVRHAVDALSANQAESVTHAEGIQAQLEEIRKDVNSNLTAALNHITLLEDALIAHGIMLPDKDPRV